MKFLKESSNKDDKLTKINILYRDAIDYGINAESLDKIFYSNGSDPDYQNLLHSPTFDRGLDVDKAYEELSDFLKKKYQPEFDRDYNDNNIPYDSYNILGFNKLAYKRELERLNKEIANLKNEYNINESKNESMNIVEKWKDFALIVKCNDGPKELVRVVADNRSKAEEYAKDLYAEIHTTYADDRYNEWSIEETVRKRRDEGCGAKKEFKEDFHPSYEDLQNGDEIIAGGQHLYVADAEYYDDYVWVTDEKEDRYNKRAPGNTLNKCLIDEVIGQPDDDDLDESLVETKSNLTAEAESLLTDVDSMSREELMDEIDGIYEWALEGKHIDITAIIEDPEVFSSTDVNDEEGYFKGVPTDKLRGILKILRKMKSGGSLTKDDIKLLTSKNGYVNEDVKPTTKEHLNRINIEVEVKSGIGGDGFKVIVKDTDGNIIEQEDFTYGYNASHSKDWADKNSPFVTDIINSYLSKYNLSKDDLVLTKGKNIFKGTDISDEDIIRFKTKYLGNLLDESKNESLKESYLDNIKNPDYWQHQVDYQLEKFGRVGGGLIQDLDEAGFYLDTDNKVVKKLHEDIIKDPKTKWTFVKSKEVEDSDGFLTDYTWYEGSDGTQVMVFGDNDIYKPEDGYFDITFTDRKQAEDWFNSY